MNIKILNFNFNKENLESEIKAQTESVVVVLDINYNDLELLDEDKSPFCNIESKFEKYNYLLSLKSDPDTMFHGAPYESFVSENQNFGFWED